MGEYIYLDHAATTPVDQRVIDAMMPYYKEFFGNPSSVYDYSAHSRKAIARARKTIADALGATDREVYFTGSGTEADNWAIKATADAYSAKGRHIITSKIEHHAVLHSCEYLEKHGYEVTYLDVDEYGFVKPEVLRRAMRPDTILVSIMFANNEIGVIEPIQELAQIAHAYGALFHTDAVQAFGQMPIDVKAMQIDMLSASAHKLYGPKGVGVLYIDAKVKIGALIHGGGQERKRRAGTENVPGIVGFGKAVELAVVKMEEKSRKQAELRDYLIDRVLEEIPFSRLNGSRTKRLPGNVNFCFQFVEGESLLIMLDMEGICASSGSACTSGAVAPSHVLLAIGLPADIAHGSLRLTIGTQNTREQMDFVIEQLKKIVAKLRKMSPAYEDFVKGNYCE